MKKNSFITIGLIIFFVICGFYNFAAADEWTNLYNSPGNNHPSFHAIWDVTNMGVNINAHTIYEWNDGLSNENFMDCRFVLNEVFASSYMTWDETNGYFTDGSSVIELSIYDGLFDNSDGSIPNMRVGIWPYLELGNMYATHDSDSQIIFYTLGNYLYLEGDTLSHVTAVPEPATIGLFLSGLLSLVGLKIKR
jgi:hypothetical protein